MVCDILHSAFCILHCALCIEKGKRKSAQHLRITICYTEAKPHRPDLTVSTKKWTPQIFCNRQIVH